MISDIQYKRRYFYEKTVFPYDPNIPVLYPDSGYSSGLRMGIGRREAANERELSHSRLWGSGPLG
jgi:hypothetical protein